MKETVNNAPSEAEIGRLLLRTSKTLAIAESCTGGFISHLITSVPGASNYYLGSVTSYSPDIKQRLLGVSPETISSNGIVSPEVASSMASGVRALMRATYSVATTGWADRYGDEHEPAGTCWMAIDGPMGVVTRKLVSRRCRSANIKRFSRLALETLLEYISSCEHIKNQLI